MFKKERKKREKKKKKRKKRKKMRVRGLFFYVQKPGKRRGYLNC